MATLLRYITPILASIVLHALLSGALFVLTRATLIFIFSPLYYILLIAYTGLVLTSLPLSLHFRAKKPTLATFLRIFFIVGLPLIVAYWIFPPESFL